MAAAVLVASSGVDVGVFAVLGWFGEEARRSAHPQVPRTAKVAMSLIVRMRCCRTSNRRHIGRLVRRHGFLENPSNLLSHRALG